MYFKGEKSNGGKLFKERIQRVNHNNGCSHKWDKKTLTGWSVFNTGLTEKCETFTTILLLQQKCKYDERVIYSMVN